MMDKLREVPVKDVAVRDDFWSARQNLIIDVALPYMEKILNDQVPGAEKSHAIENFRIAAGAAQGQFYGMVFQDSDVYKWIEAAAYALAVRPDRALEGRVDEIVDLIARAQCADGYLNTYFTLQEPQNRWTNLLECHELYCAGHLMEAAVAYHEATGKDRLLGVATRLADHIVDRFGAPGDPAVPGHQEVEIGLLRLYRATGNRAYLDMALRFIDARGAGDYFAAHTPAHPGRHYGGYDMDPCDGDYNQSYAPVREQQDARGHAVRMAYMLTAMADLAAEVDDPALRAACARLWDNITGKRMYVTGAIGSTPVQEAFTADYHLPGDTAYGETCASVAMAFLAKQMLRGGPEGRYADILETELWGGALAGMALDGQRYFYVNPLEVDPAVAGRVPGYKHVLPQRPPWHACACCPTNLARLIASLGSFLWSESGTHAYSHLLVGNVARLRHGTIALETGYPWAGTAKYTVEPATDQPFTLAIHIPGYVEGLAVTLNGAPCAPTMAGGYCHIRRVWTRGDQVALSFPMAPRRLYAHPAVAACAGRVALARGPIVYCFEGVDNPGPLSALRLPRSAPVAELPYDSDLLGGIVPLTAPGRQAQPTPGLYGAAPPQERDVPLRAVPYYAWGNRGLNAMAVWIRE